MTSWYVRMSCNRWLFLPVQNWEKILWVPQLRPVLIPWVFKSNTCMFCPVCVYWFIYCTKVAAIGDGLMSTACFLTHYCCTHRAAYQNGRCGLQVFFLELSFSFRCSNTYSLLNFTRRLCLYSSTTSFFVHYLQYTLVFSSLTHHK